MSAFKIAAIILCCAALAFSITMLVRMVKMTKELKATGKTKEVEDRWPGEGEDAAQKDFHDGDDA